MMKNSICILNKNILFINIIGAGRKIRDPLMDQKLLNWLMQRKIPTRARNSSD